MCDSDQARSGGIPQFHLSSRNVNGQRRNTQCLSSGRLRVVKHNGKSSQNIEGSISHDTERERFLHTCNSYAVGSIKTNFISNVFANLRLPHPVTQPARKLGGRKIWGSKQFDFRRITLFCLVKKPETGESQIPNAYTSKNLATLYLKTMTIVTIEE